LGRWLGGFHWERLGCERNGRVERKWGGWWWEGGAWEGGKREGRGWVAGRRRREGN
jgi:hypothetical protein